MPARPAVRAGALLVALSLLGASGCGDDTTSDAPDTTTTSGAPAASTAVVEPLTVEVRSRRAHDPAAFTEGLTFDDEGRLYESLGLEGASSVREVDPDTGDVVREATLDADEFGEGLAVRDGELYQLTWKNGVVHRWDPSDLTRTGRGSFEGEGWGLTYDGERFVQTDGSTRLLFRDPDAFEPPTSSVEVTRDGEPVDELNELEWVDGVVWANVWHSDEIMRIDPASGRVTGVVDASALWQSPDRGAEMTLNGIAHRPGDPPDRLWLTGKNWPEMFEVEVRAA